MKTLYQRQRRKMPTEFLPESSEFFARLAAHGGTIANASMLAVDQFVRDLFQNDLWDRLWDAGLFVGGQLAAALVKLKYPPNVPDALTNVNFAAADYAETGANGGLLGDGTSKWLRTGLAQSALGATGHLSFYARENLPNTSYHTMLGAGSESDDFILRQNGPNVTGQFGESVAVSLADLSPGFFCVVRSNARDLRLFKNGLQVSADTTEIAAGSTDNDFGVFADNVDDSPVYHLDTRGSFYSIGQPLTPAQVAALYAAVQTLQSALNRAV